MDVPSWCRVGQKVVCIDGGQFNRASDEIVPETGGIYTIRDVELFDGFVFLRFVEVVNEPYQYAEAFGEVNFSSHGFRPLVSQQDDIKTHFQALLDQPMREVV